MQNIQNTHQPSTSSGSATNEVTASHQEEDASEVSQEFLDALPPSLQEEVISQQRMLAASRSNPDEPVDAGAFFETLQPSLRTMVSILLLVAYGWLICNRT